jgi:ABC-2 type transport system permease protein
MKFSLNRVWAMTLRHLFNFRHNLDRIVDAFYWPALDIVIWGLTISALQKQGQAQLIQVASVLFGSILWYVIWRGQGEIAINLLEEFWSENLVNLFSTPLTIVEWMASLFLIGIVKLTMTVVFTAILALILYSVNITLLGWAIIPLVVSLMLTGWAFGLFMAGLFFRHGTNIQTLAWAGGFVLMPFSATFYPLATLPVWIQKVAAFIPSSYIFESMRSILFTGTFSVDFLVKSYVLNFVYLTLAVFFFVRSFQQAKERGIAHLK